MPAEEGKEGNDGIRPWPTALNFLIDQDGVHQLPWPAELELFLKNTMTSHWLLVHVVTKDEDNKDKSVAEVCLPLMKVSLSDLQESGLLGSGCFT